ncbi:CHAT domain-containing protein [Lewinella cohaerens]|uniref:CHAT domain-containing protein n=1 Tax=Lewinella cohaerens TaxID=70995 RepID=UPI00035DA0C7|nr:CHAT domain-containing protein [Lewinella cohaerens]
MRFLSFFILLYGCLTVQVLQAQSLAPSDTITAQQYVSEALKSVSQRENNKALVYSDSAIIIYSELGYENDSLRLADAWLGKAAALKGLGDYDPAIELFSAVIITKKTLPTAKNLRNIAYSYNSLGNMYSDMGNFDLAVENYNASLAVKSDYYGEKHRETLFTKMNIASLYSQYGFFDEAIEQYQGMVMELEGNSEVDTTQFQIQLSMLIGNTYGRKGDHDNAIIFHSKSYQLIESVLDGDDHLKASLLSNLGIGYKNKGKLERSIAYHDQALFMRIRIFGENTPQVANSYMNMAVTYLELKDWEKAVEYSHKAITIFEQFDWATGSLLMVYDNLGIAYAGMKNYQKALEYQYLGLLGLEKLYGKDYPALANSYQIIGSTYQEQGIIDSAIHYFTKSLSLCEKSGMISSKFILQNNLGRAYLAAENYTMAKEVLALNVQQNSFVKDSENLDDVIIPIDYLGAMNELARAYFLEYQINSNPLYLDTAFMLQNKSLEAYSYFRLRSAEQDDNTLLTSIPLLLSNYCSMLAYTDDPLKAINAFNYLQAMKSVVLLKAINDAEAKNFAGISEEFLQRELKLQRSITEQEKLKQALIEEEETLIDTAILRLSTVIFDLREEYGQLKNKLEKENAAYYQAKYNLASVSLDEVQNSLLEENQSIVEYFIGDKSLFIFLVQKNNFEIQEVLLDTVFSQWVTDMTQEGIFGYYNAPGAKQSRRNYARSLLKYTNAATRLYKLLIAPVENKLTEEIIFVPDGVLGYIPFEALLKQKPDDYNDLTSYKYLVYDHQVSYTYSTTLLRELKEKVHYQEPSGSLLAFAPFFVGNADTLVAHTDTTLQDFNLVLKDSLSALLESGEEIKIISELYNGDPYYGSEASIELFLTFSPRYRILHLSTHAEADDRVGDYAYLAFGWPGKESEFAKLYARDLYNLSLNADMVVLSACETGRGKLRQGEGVISLARAFAYAGAKSIFTTLWKVEEGATKDLVLAFYKYLDEGYSKDKALRFAKMEYLKNNSASPELTHPFFWASMIGIGDMTEMKIP